LSQIAINVKHPTLCTWGSADDYCPPDMHRRIQAACRMNGSLCEFTSPGTQGHALSVLRNQAWLDDFTAFLTAKGAHP
jgi:hypothetical protein